jgi:hypothetical protein
MTDEERLRAIEAAARLHIMAWRAYFAESGGQPERLWPSFARLMRALEGKE